MYKINILKYTLKHLRLEKNICLSSRGMRHGAGAVWRTCDVEAYIQQWMSFDVYDENDDFYIQISTKDNECITSYFVSIQL